VRPLANSLGHAGCCLVLAACGGENAPAVAPPQARIVDMAQLDAELKQNLGRGTLVSVWATW
jgi:hypothetical protein